MAGAGLEPCTLGGELVPRPVGRIRRHRQFTAMTCEPRLAHASLQGAVARAVFVAIVGAHRSFTPRPLVPLVTHALVGGGVAHPLTAAVVGAVGDVVMPVEALESVVAVTVEVNQHLQGETWRCIDTMLSW